MYFLKISDLRLPRWITSFQKQCFVTFVVIFNMWFTGMVGGYPTPLLHQLRQPDSKIPIDDSSGSWIASIVAIAALPSNFVITAIMGKFGRKVALFSSVVTMLVGWLGFTIATNLTVLFIARVIQGFAMGMGTVLSPVLVGEYTSPRNRGAFLTTVTIAFGSGILYIHTVGFYQSWEMTALSCVCLAFFNLLMIIFIPESPGWLIDQERYEESKKVFRWLRGENEEDELRETIEATILRKSKPDSPISQSLMKTNLTYCVTTIGKREFYVPIIIMIHMYVLVNWSGTHLFSSYAIDIIDNVVGTDVNTSSIVISLGVLRIIFSICAIYIFKRTKRRTVLFTTVFLNIVILLITAGYNYAKSHDMLPFDHPSIGIVLSHILNFTIAIGIMPLIFIVAGEIFPLEYRSLASGISGIALTPNYMIVVKTVPFLFKTIGLHGAYCIYAGIMGYCLLIIGMLLPETKDRTLQDIENEFKGSA